MLSSVTALTSNIYFCFLRVSCLLWFFHSYVWSLHDIIWDDSGLYPTLSTWQCNAVVSHYWSHFLLDLGDLCLFLFPFYSLIPAPLLFQSPLRKCYNLILWIRSPEIILHFITSSHLLFILFFCLLSSVCLVSDPIFHTSLLYTSGRV